MVNPKHGTADICDLHSNSVQVMELSLISYGGISRCCGQIITFHIDEDNRVLKSKLRNSGNGQVAVVDVAGDICAVVGDQLASIAIENGWAGIILNGYLRDTERLRKMPICIWALGAYPRRSSKLADGSIGSTLKFGGVNCITGSYLYADEDGIVFAENKFEDISFVE